MCRIAAYVGPAAPLSSLLYDPPHSLERQSYQPRELVHGTVNVDGTGVAWWPDESAEPVRYVSVDTPWADPNLPGLATRISGHTMLAAVRSATPGLPFGPDHVAPYTAGSIAGAHNGSVSGFRGVIGRQIISLLSDEQWANLGVLNDSKALFHAVADNYSGDLITAIRTVVRTTTGILDAHDASATLNLVVADGAQIVATRHSVRAPLNSLYTASRGDSHLIASEPLDGGEEWKPVPEHNLVAVTATTTTTIPLK